MSLRARLGGLYNALPPRVHHLFNNYNKFHDFYSKAQWWDKERIEIWQLNRLQQIFKMAYEQTDGYHQLFDEFCVKPEDLQSMADLKNFPLTDKELIRNNVVAFTNKNNHNLARTSTSGSTGTPFSFFADRKYSNVEYAFMNSLWESAGWNVTDVGLKIRGGLNTDSDVFICKKTAYHRYTASSQYLNEINYERIKAFINRNKVTFLHVYPSTVADLSQLIIDHNEEGTIPIRHIFVGSEKFYPWQFELTQRAFPQTKIVHWYGHSERAIWATWCEHSNLFHICPFYGYTEIVKEDGADSKTGESGELVGTAFWMEGTFFIRYKTGDTAVVANKGNCELCGRSYKLLSAIEGRKQDFIIGKSGRKLSLTVFDGWAMHGTFFSNIRLFRFVQDEVGKLLLKIVPKAPFDNSEYNEFKQKIQSFFGNDYDIEFLIVNDISRSANGKYSYLEQHLKKE